VPALPAVPQVLKVVVQGNTSEASPVTWANVMHFAYSGTAPSGTVCNTIAAEIGTLWNSHMAAECPSPTVQNLVEVFDLTSSTSGSGSDGSVHAGTRGGDEIPANVAMLVNCPISRRYRGGHPRQYLIVGGNADFLDAAHWSTAFTAEVQTHWQAFMSGIVGYSTGGCTISNFVSVSYYSKEVNPIPPYRRTIPLVDDITISTCFTEQQMASQRRRIGRHRR
jgi:hypothetical protein